MRRISFFVMAGVSLLFTADVASAQAIRCENLVFSEERIACYHYRAMRAGGPSCLFCAPQQPVKRTKKQRKRPVTHG